MSHPLSLLKFPPIRGRAMSDTAARRAAQRFGLRATKSRRRRDHENLGEFMLVDPQTGFPVAGFRYDLSAEEVIAYCDEPVTTDDA